jgi:hypothetical protein
MGHGTSLNRLKSCSLIPPQAIVTGHSNNLAYDNSEFNMFFGFTGITSEQFKEIVSTLNCIGICPKKSIKIAAGFLALRP